MAVNYISQKCTSCAGTRFEYLKDEKMWQCLYCGAKIERQEQADTMFTIKNVVRQSIIDVAWGRLDSAQKNIVECEKIDSRYVGTLIAQIAYEFNMMYYGDLPKEQQRNMFAQMKKHYLSLRSTAATPSDEELVLYEFLDTDEAVGALILVFDGLKDTARVQVLREQFSPEKIYSMKLNSKMILYAIRHEDYELVDKITDNTDNIDKKNVIHLLLQKYPDRATKSQTICKLIGDGEFFHEEDKKKIETYVQESEDSVQTKYDIVLPMMQIPAVCPCVDTLLTHIVSKIEAPEKAEAMLNVLMSRSLLDIEIGRIIDFALADGSGPLCLYVIKHFSESERFVELTYPQLVALLQNEKMDQESKLQVIDIAFSMNVSSKMADRCIAAYLTEIQDKPENRKAILEVLLSKCELLSVNTVEKYLLTAGVDGDAKPEIVKSIFAMDINRSIYRGVLINYLLKCNDAYAVKYEIICILQDAGLRASVDACMDFLRSAPYAAEEKITIINKLREASVGANELYNAYISQIDASCFDPQIHAALLSSITSVQEKALQRYVLWLPDVPAAKPGNVRKLCSLVTCPPTMMSCEVSLNGMKVECNLINGYIIASKDDPEIMKGVLEALGASAHAYRSEAYVNGKKVQFAKYMHSKAKEIPEQLLTRCKTFGVF